jgi:hypothetical protein
MQDVANKPFVRSVCYAECRYAECNYTECHGAKKTESVRPKILFLISLWPIFGM